MRRFLALSFLFSISCSQQNADSKSSATTADNSSKLRYFDTCACFSSTFELAINYRDPIDLVKASKEISDSCRSILSMDNALNNLQECNEVLIQLETFDSVKMSEFIQNSRFLFSNIADMP
jgi:hypothetical protein